MFKVSPLSPYNSVRTPRKARIRVTLTCPVCRQYGRDDDFTSGYTVVKKSVKTNRQGFTNKPEKCIDYKDNLSSVNLN